jgi:hypothetical protein
MTEHRQISKPHLEHPEGIVSPPKDDALRNAVKAEGDSNQQFIVPRGWTTLIHGTDTDRWKLGEPRKVVTGLGLSAITAAEAAEAKALAIRMGNPGAYDTTASYARRNPSATPVEVRVLFYRDDLARNRVPAADVADIKAGLGEDTLRLVTKYYPSRHPVIPRGEELIRLGLGPSELNPRIVEYFVPRSVAGDYVESAQAHIPPYAPGEPK